MLSDEEKNVIDLLKNIDKQKCLMLNCPVVKNNIERQLKIIELNRIIRKQSKEIEELKAITNSYNSYGGNLMNDTRIIICDSRYFLNGTFVNKFVSKDKIKAIIEEIDEVLKGQLIEKIRVYFEAQKEVLQSLLEKE